LAAGWSHVLGERLTGDLELLSPKARSSLP
jgi:hypothetical protein